jgi:hypothetical protein
MTNVINAEYVARCALQKILQCRREDRSGTIVASNVLPAFNGARKKPFNMAKEQ